MTNVLEDRTICESQKACAEACPLRCETSPIDEVPHIAHILETQGRFGLTRGFIQHGTMSVHAHVISVAHASLAMAGRLERLGVVHAHVISVANASLAMAGRPERLGVRIDRASLIRGALLHDYFLYDWHDPDPSHRLHGFTHPFAALARAEEDFDDLTERERNIISRHMFPLVPIPPTCSEAWLVSLADKPCALHQTIAGLLHRRSIGCKEVSH